MPLEPGTAARFHPLTVAAVAPETDEAVTVTFEPPPALRAAFAWQAGQYLTLRTTQGAEDVRRAYSICAAPGEALRVAIKRVEGGRFSPWAHSALRAGQVIDAMPPAGRFVLPPATAPRHLLAVAAGSGITPILAILRAALLQEPGTRATLLYGSRSTAQILFRDELEALKDRYMARLSIVHVLSREQQDIPMLNGRLDGPKIAALLPALFPDGLPDHALLCGPGAMIDTVASALAGAGLPDDGILSERFSTGPNLPRPVVQRMAAAAHAVAKIVSDGLSTDVPMRADETVLDAALRAGLDLPYSCRGGMCSTCRARVTDGAVTMDVNYGLEPWETAAGFVLTCQARPTTARVTVDYDHV